MTIWLPTVGYDGYLVSNDGQVRSLKGGKDRIMRQHLDPAGYYRVSLSSAPLHRDVPVHTQVCKAFHGLPEDPGLEVRHLDGNPLNNRADNLKWGTRAENMQDRIAHGGNPSLRKTHCPHGHPYDEVNTAYNGKQRVCKTCRSIQDKRRYYRKRSGGVAA